MKRIIFFLSIAISIYSQTYNPSLLSCMISVEKDTFLIDEPIYVEFKETNIGNVDVLTNRFHCDGPFYSEMLIGPDGKKIGRHGGIRYGLYDKPATGYLLKPSESQYFVIPIHGYYGYSYRGPETNRSFYLPPGKYSFQITHYTNDNYLYEKTQAEFSKVKKSIDRMLIVSNKLVFYIVTPNAEQEKERLAYLECRRTYGWEKNKEEIIRLYREYFDKYKNSPLFYKYDLMIGLEMYLSSPGDTKIFYTREEILSEIKNSYRSYNLCESGIQNYDDLKNDDRRYTPKIEGYKRIANKYPDTQISKYLLMKVSENEQFKKKWLKSGKTE